MATLTSTNGIEFQVDDDDVDILSSYRWGAYVMNKDSTGKRYVMGRVNGRRAVYLHRFLMQPKRSETVDHINLNPLDNRRSNLRIASRSQQGMNREKPSNNTSGFKGVYWDKARGRWKAQIKTKGVYKGLGRFSTPEQAAVAYDDAAKKLHGEFAVLNFPSNNK